MDQILVSVCCSPQNEHTDIKKLQTVMWGYLKQRLLQEKLKPIIHFII